MFNVNVRHSECQSQPPSYLFTCRQPTSNIQPNVSPTHYLQFIFCQSERKCSPETNATANTVEKRSHLDSIWTCGYTHAQTVEYLHLCTLHIAFLCPCPTTIRMLNKFSRSTSKLCTQRGKGGLMGTCSHRATNPCGGGPAGVIGNYAPPQRYLSRQYFLGKNVPQTHFLREKVPLGTLFPRK